MACGWEGLQDWGGWGGEGEEQGGRGGTWRLEGEKEWGGIWRLETGRLAGQVAGGAGGWLG